MVILERMRGYFDHSYVLRVFRSFSLFQEVNWYIQIFVEETNIIPVEFFFFFLGEQK